MRAILLAASVVSLLGWVGSASADDRFHPVPGNKDTTSGLQLRVVDYDGTSNGKMTIEVVNRGSAMLTFTASGLYFVPDGDTDEAPQRLASVGQFKIVGDKEGVRRQSIDIKAGASKTLQVDVFCVDSHRHSPSYDTEFSPARHRMPLTLATTITRNAIQIARTQAGLDDPSTRQAIQSSVWQTRAVPWIALDGEGNQEHHRDDDDDDE